MTTRNPKRRPHWMAIQLESGPFRRFDPARMHVDAARRVLARVGRS